MSRLTLQHVEADAPQAVDVGVVDLGEEANLGRRHGVVVGKEQLQLEHSACTLVSSPDVRRYRREDKHTLVGGLARAIDGHVEVPQVVVVRCCRDSLNSAHAHI